HSQIRHYRVELSGIDAKGCQERDRLLSNLDGGVAEVPAPVVRLESVADSSHRFVQEETSVERVGSVVIYRSPESGELRNRHAGLLLNLLRIRNLRNNFGSDVAGLKG